MPPPVNASTAPSCNRASSATNTTTATRQRLPLHIPAVSDSASTCQSLSVTLPKCLFKTKMRIPKRPCVSLCLSFFSPSHQFSLHHHFSSRVPQFRSPTIDYRLFSRPPGQFISTRRGFCSQGPCQLRASFTLDGPFVDKEMSNVQGSNCNDHAQDPCIWSSPEGGKGIAIGKQIFCNRAVNMKSIVAVGFDMDYTLAQYIPETFEALAYGGTIRKLVYDLGYPEELLEWSFDWKYMVRGLVLDKKRGNILKMDRHKYVKVAYHGFREMLKEEKVATYGSTLVRDAFDEPDYALIDTLFSLAEAYLFAQLVDFKDNNPGEISEHKDYFFSSVISNCQALNENPVGWLLWAVTRSYKWAGSEKLEHYAHMYKDVRAAVDLCHRDGTLKQMVASDPKRYINEDKSIVPMLKMLRASDRATFLVTNSLWDYTNVVMNFLCGPHTSDSSSSLSFDWLQYFDVVITGSAKPGFFHDENRASLFEVDAKSGMLLNTDNGSPMAQVGSTSVRLPAENLKTACRVFQGGNVGHLHKLLSVESSSQVLYVGDHIYGDILRSKKVLVDMDCMSRCWCEQDRKVVCNGKSRVLAFDSPDLLYGGWRTMLVVPELEKEVEFLWGLRGVRKHLRLLRNKRDQIEDKLHHIKWSFQSELQNSEEKEKLLLELGELECDREHVRVSHQNAQRECHQKFHKVWGQLMKTGYQNSRFAHQVERFACLYTSQVSNLSLYSPDKYYRPAEDFMPHEMDMF